MNGPNTLAVGFFDGVHLGHQKILRSTSAVLTFRNHPLTLLAPERAPRLILTPEERLQAIRDCGVERVMMLDFTRQIAELSPLEFLKEYILSGKGPQLCKRIRCGENWRFGKDGAGDAAFARQAGIETEIVPTAEYKGERISSTRIRACLERGEIEDANAMMGRRFKIKGRRSKGKGLGKEIGFPTINLALSTSVSDLNLSLGVYEVEMDGARGVANYGRAPTWGGRAWDEPVLEVHLLGAQPPDFRPQAAAMMAVDLIRFIRPERTFDSVDALTRQIAADCASVGQRVSET